MKKAHVNVPDSETHTSDYLIEVVYKDGDSFEKEVTNYPYSSIFELIKENHKDEHDRAVESISVKFIR